MASISTIIYFYNLFLKFLEYFNSSSLLLEAGEAKTHLFLALCQISKFLVFFSIAYLVLQLQTD